VTRESPLGRLLRNVELIIWDEVTMQNRFASSATCIPATNCSGVQRQNEPFQQVGIRRGGPSPQSIPLHHERPHFLPLLSLEYHAGAPTDIQASSRLCSVGIGPRPSRWWSGGIARACSPPACAAPSSGVLSNAHLKEGKEPLALVLGALSWSQ
jgi:hypothetical protein